MPTLPAKPPGWVLETAHTAYALGFTANGLLLNRFWGARLPLRTDYPPPAEYPNFASFTAAAHLSPEEFPAYAGASYVEPCLKLLLPDGVRDAVLKFEKAELRDGDTYLIIHLRDAFYPVQVALHYRAHHDADLIERWAVITNAGPLPITVERLFSAQVHLPLGEPYRLTHVVGKWSAEFQLERETLTHGVKVLESRRLTTSHHHNPWFMLDRGGADEEQGEVWFGALAWSGNWKLTAETTDFFGTRVSLGFNDWDFTYVLNAGENLSAPRAFFGYTKGGFGAASRILHGYIRKRVLPHREQLHKVLYNSWEATTFNVSERAQMKIAKIAASLGCELFVVDDGWFHKRKNDTAGLGDWWADAKKFPNGLGPLVAGVNKLGMDFGIWVEPEMVNANSDLYRAHPDWVFHFPNRKRTEMRNQMILNLARTDVREYLYSKLHALLSDHNIAFVKWDMNRNISEPGWPDAPGDARELWVRYVGGLYELWGRLRDSHPQVIFQSCSGGGGRVDMGILQYADQVWVSDNTDAPSRLSIQEGFSYAYPASIMEAWVTDAGYGTVPLEFRLHVAMAGTLGIGGDLLKWDEEERALAAKWIAYYKQIRPVVQDGDLYRLHRLDGGYFNALQYMLPDRSEGVLFGFRIFSPQYLPYTTNTVLLPMLHLRGLDPAATYQIEGIDAVRSGAAWMDDGLRLSLPNFGSTVRRIRRV